ncbi:hypothetical protein Sjap_013342 [Stephania japonica]|uniref:Uncharacterized protein n=1 Tax=Stephania japonica TaxID=461633 RepID=A0AAP0IYI7_9MAGN
MAVRKPGLISLFDVYGTLTAPRKNCCLCYLAWSLNLEPEFTNIIDLEKARQWKVLLMLSNSSINSLLVTFLKVNAKVNAKVKELHQSIRSLNAQPMSLKE